MAQIVLSGEELVGVLQANGWVPEEVTALEADDREVRLKLRTPVPLLKSIGVTVQFVGFDSGQLILRIATNRLIDSFNGLISKWVESFSLADYGGRWEYPRLYIGVNQLLRQRVHGVRIDDVVFQEGCFHIKTTHLPSGRTVADDFGTEEVRSPVAS
jgi:hypothetical protein